MENLLEGETVTIKQRQDITRTAVHKLMATYGNYPSKDKRRNVAMLLADVLKLESHIFYTTRQPMKAFWFVGWKMLDGV